MSFFIQINLKIGKLALLILNSLSVTYFPAFSLFSIIDQLERVFLRLGHAETDEQLQDIISKFLPPVLLKLSSVQEGVRKKVSV